MLGRILLGVGAAAATSLGVWALLSHEEARAEEEWLSRCEDLSDEIDFQRDRLKEHKENAQNTVQFHKLVNDHHASVTLSNEVYALLKEAQSVINVYRNNIKALKQKRTDLKNMISSNHSEKKQLMSSIRELKKTIDAQYIAMENAYLHKNDLAEKVAGLNYETRQIKFMIRDNTGAKGREWYENLERRKANKY